MFPRMTKTAQGLQIARAVISLMPPSYDVVYVSHRCVCFLSHSKSWCHIYSTLHAPPTVSKPNLYSSLLPLCLSLADFPPVTRELHESLSGCLLSPTAQSYLSSPENRSARTTEQN